MSTELRELAKEYILCVHNYRTAIDRFGCPGKFLELLTTKQQALIDALNTPAQTDSEAIEALRVLVKMYVANRGNPQSEFITCITPSHSSDMTPRERAKDKTWKAWDSARSILARYDRK